jgi:hypothetical protein
MATDSLGMFINRKFEVDIVREIDAHHLDWPERGNAGHDSGLGCNREYSDLRWLSWGEAKRVFRLEGDLIARIESASDPEVELEAIEEESFECTEHLYGLDLGVASTAIALSAAGCVPFSSCNGGAFGGRHYEQYPLVAFFARAHAAELLLSAAEEANIGVHGRSYLIVYADDIRNMRSFAQCLTSRRPLFSAIRKRTAGSKRTLNESQPDLPFT